MDRPAFKLTVAATFAGLLYRALADDASPGQAPVHMRQLELAQVEHTERLKHASVLKSELAIAADKLAAARQQLETSAADRAIHAARRPPLSRPGLLRRIFGKRQRDPREEELALLEEEAASRAEAAQSRHTALEQQLEEANRGLAEITGERQRLSREAEQQLAVQVLGLAAAGKHDKALQSLSSARQRLRGSLMVGVLLACSALLDPEQELDAGLREARLIFEQYPDPLERVLTALQRHMAGQPVSPSALGLAPPGNFSGPAYYRLYTLAAVLAGQGYDADGIESPLFHATLTALSFARSGAQTGLPEPLPPAADAVGRALVAVPLVARGRLAELWQLSGIAAEDCQPPRRRRGPWPSLWMLASPEPPPAWPEALAAPWASFYTLALLLASRGRVDAAVHARWVRESYNWPKSDFYWWVQAELADDAALARNIRRGHDEPVDVPV